MAAAALCPLGPTLTAEATERQRVERPSFARLWVLALEQATRDGHLPEHVESALPSWWRPGMPVWRSEPEAVSDMADAPCVDDALQDPDQKSAEDPEDFSVWAQPRKRARRSESSPVVKAWFCNLTACHLDWRVAECFRYAKRLRLWQMLVDFIRARHCHCHTGTRKRKQTEIRQELI